MKKIWGGKGLRNKLIIIGSFVLLAIIILAGRSEGNIIRQAGNLTGGEIANLAQTVSLKGVIDLPVCETVEYKQTGVKGTILKVPPLVPAGTGDLDWSDPLIWELYYDEKPVYILDSVEIATSTGNGCWTKINKICTYNVGEKIKGVRALGLDLSIKGLVKDCLMDVPIINGATLGECLAVYKGVKIVNKECHDWYYDNFHKSSQKFEGVVDFEWLKSYLPFKQPIQYP